MASDLLPVTTSLPCQLPSKPIDIRQMLTFFSIWQDALLATNLVFCLAEKTPSHHLEITFILLSPHPYKYPRLSVSVLSFCGNQRHDTSSKIYFFHWVLVFLSFFLVLLISSNMYSVSTSSFPWALRYTHVSLMLKKKKASVTPLHFQLLPHLPFCKELFTFSVSNYTSENDSCLLTSFPHLPLTSQTTPD